ncbi:MAG: hypothetical protein QNJ16_05615 [Rhodobacter sp.]|nr:hypothetical protein [Rhodobacter sp.]
MSETDSFIEEVSEEVRRERLFRYIRRYGWIAVLLVVVLVGGAAYNEWSKAQTRAAAEARGDAILAALEASDADARQAALAEIDADGRSAAIVALLTASEAVSADNEAAAVASLQAIEADTAQPELYRQLATLKRLILTTADTAPADRIAALEPLTAPGAAFRILAEEQIAVAEADAGDTAAALTRLQGLLNDTEATPGLRQRVSQLIVALGGEPETTGPDRAVAPLDLR